MYNKKSGVRMYKVFKYVALCVAMFGLCTVSEMRDARADRNVGFAQTAECGPLLKANMKVKFTSPAEEINYTNKYNTCWAEAVVINSKMARNSYLGKGLTMMAHPEYIEALPFSKHVCNAGRRVRGMVRLDYPCIFELETVKDNPSLDEAIRRESPKVLFANEIIKSGTSLVEYVICTNDDPTKAKEYSKGCLRGKKFMLSEYGRGDTNGDGILDVVVSVTFGDNADTRRKCYMAVFTRKDAEMVKMINFSPVGLCQ